MFSVLSHKKMRVLARAFYCDKTIEQSLFNYSKTRPYSKTNNDQEAMKLSTYKIPYETKESSLKVF